VRRTALCRPADFVPSSPNVNNDAQLASPFRLPGHAPRQSHRSAKPLKGCSEICSRQVYDLRMTARVTTTIPFSAGPSLLRFHPRFPGTLLVASSTGHFILSQVQAAAFAPLMQVCFSSNHAGMSFIHACKYDVHACNLAGVTLRLSGYTDSAPPFPREPHGFLLCCVA